MARLNEELAQHTVAACRFASIAADLAHRQVRLSEVLGRVESGQAALAAAVVELAGQLDQVCAAEAILRRAQGPAGPRRRPGAGHLRPVGRDAG